MELFWRDMKGEFLFLGTSSFVPILIFPGPVVFALNLHRRFHICHVQGWQRKIQVLSLYLYLSKKVSCEDPIIFMAFLSLLRSRRDKSSSPFKL
jgi:hypothetical protein